MKRSLPVAAVRRADQGIAAFSVLADHSDEIVAACAAAPAGSAVIGVVRADLRFDWAWTVPFGEIGERVVGLPDGGWALLFACGASPAEVRQSLERVARLARARHAAIHRFQARL